MSFVGLEFIRISSRKKKVVASSFWNVVIGDRVAFLKIERTHLWIYNDIYGYKNQKHQLKYARSHVSISLPWNPGICGLHADHKYLGEKRQSCGPNMADVFSLLLPGLAAERSGMKSWMQV